MKLKFKLITRLLIIKHFKYLNQFKSSLKPGNTVRLNSKYMSKKTSVEFNFKIVWE